jgi:hypothetical protein
MITDVFDDNIKGLLLRAKRASSDEAYKILIDGYIDLHRHKLKLKAENEKLKKQNTELKDLLYGTSDVDRKSLDEILSECFEDMRQEQ